ncbi:MAG: hypothetical protein GC181_10700 [Bacteroidetes bacterium]|nr:hypothetical protein [Bacteroidota bacterium]
MKLILVFLLISLVLCTCTNQNTEEAFSIGRYENLLEMQTVTSQLRIIDSILTTPITPRLEIMIREKEAKLYVELRRYEMAKNSLNQALRLAEQNPEELCIIKNNMAIIYAMENKYDSSILLQLDVIECHKSRNDTVRLIESLGNVALMYKEVGDYHKSILISQQALRLTHSRSNQTKIMARIYSVMANSYKGLGLNTKSLEYHRMSLNAQLALRDWSASAKSFNNIALVYRNIMMYDSALYNFELYLRHAEMSNDTPMMIKAHTNLADLFSIIKNNPAAEHHFTFSQKLLRTYSTPALKCNYLIKKAKWKQDNHKYDSALFLVDSAIQISRANNLLPERKEALELMMNVGNLMNHPELNLSEFAIEYGAIIDSIAKNEWNENLAKNEASFELYRAIDTINNLDITSKRRRNIIIGLLLMAMILGLIIWYTIILTRRLSHAKRRIEILLDDLTHRTENNYQIIYSLINLQKQNATDNTLSILNSVQQRIVGMSALHVILDNYETRKISMDLLVRNLSQRMCLAYGIDEARCVNYKIDYPALASENAPIIGRIIIEALTNCFKHAFPTVRHPLVCIQFYFSDSNYHLSIHDNGDKLVKPKVGTGLGISIIEGLVKELNGEFVVTQQNGYLITFKFPKI